MLRQTRETEFVPPWEWFVFIALFVDSMFVWQDGPVVIEVEEREDEAGLPYCLACLACWVGCACLWPFSGASCILACLTDSFKRRGNSSYRVCWVAAIVVSIFTIVVGIFAWVFFFIYIFPSFYRMYWWQ